MWRKSADVKPSSQQPSAPSYTSWSGQSTAAPASTQTPATAQTPSQPAPQPAQHASAAPVAAAQSTSRDSVSSSASRIGAGLKIRGEFSGKSDLWIDGEAQGKIRLAEARVTVGPTGRVQADIEAREIVVEGTVQGNLKGAESVRLGASSHVQGSVLTPRLAIDEGARLRGTVETTRASESRNSPAAEQPAEVDKFEKVPVRAEVL